jgi:hypothetical protein
MHLAMRVFLVLALALPAVQAVLVWVRGLLAAMGDGGGAAMVGHVGTACQVAWAISLVGLLISTALVLNEERQETPRGYPVKSREPDEDVID